MKDKTILTIYDCNLFTEDLWYIESISKVRGDKSRFVRDAVAYAVAQDKLLNGKENKNAR